MSNERNPALDAVQFVRDFVQGYDNGARSGDWYINKARRIDIAAVLAAALRAPETPPADRPERHGYGCPNDGDDMDPTVNCVHCCGHGWVERVQGKPCPRCYPAETPPRETAPADLVAAILADYPDEQDKAACDRCEQCGPVAMCSFHSVISMLMGRTKPTAFLSSAPAPPAMEE